MPGRGSGGSGGRPWQRDLFWLLRWLPGFPRAPPGLGWGCPAQRHTATRDSSLAHPLPPADGHPHGGRLGCDGCGAPKRAGVPASGPRAPPPARGAPTPSAGHLPCPQPAPGHPCGRPHGPQDGGIDWLGEEAEQASPCLRAAGLSLTPPGLHSRTPGGVRCAAVINNNGRGRVAAPTWCRCHSRGTGLGSSSSCSPGRTLPNLPHREEAEAEGGLE